MDSIKSTKARIKPKGSFIDMIIAKYREILIQSNLRSAGNAKK